MRDICVVQVTGQAAALSSSFAGRMGFSCPTSSYTPPEPVYVPQSAAPRLAAAPRRNAAAAVAAVVAAAAWALAGGGGGGGGGGG